MGRTAGKRTEQGERESTRIRRREERGEQDEKGRERLRGSRVSSFDPLSLLCVESRESPYLSLLRFERVAPTPRPKARERARNVFSPPFSTSPPPRLAGDDRDEPASLWSRLVPFPYFGAPPRDRTALLASEPRYAPATVTSLRVV